MLLLLSLIQFFATSYGQNNRIGPKSYGDLLASVSKQTSSSYKLADKVVAKTTFAYQQKTVTGRVTDANGNPLAGVTIIEKTTTNGTISDPKGNYSINVSSVNSILVFTYIGFNPQEIPVGAQYAINVSLAESTLQLTEVVIVGYGSQKKETVTGSVSAVTNAKLIQSPVANISQSLAGRISGLLSVQREGQPGLDQSTIRIRGAGTYAGSTDPLIMIDGIEAQSYNNIDPYEIESISILKDASATAVYGVRGANGVMIITTKRGQEGAPQVSFTSNFAIQSFASLKPNTDSYTYANDYNEALRYNSYITGSYSPRWSSAEIQKFKDGSDPIFYPNTDWMKLLLKPYSGQLQDNFNISGGSKYMKYFVSVGYFSQEGLFKNTEWKGMDTQFSYHRYNIRSNFDFNITKRLTANLNISSQLDKTAGGGGGEQTLTNGFIMNTIELSPPYNSPGIINGKIVENQNVFEGNPYKRLLYGYVQNLANYLNGSFRLNYMLDFITKGLSTHGTISYQSRLGNNKSYYFVPVIYTPLRLPDATIEYLPQTEEQPFYFGESYNKTRKIYAEIGFDYARSFGDHNIGGLLLYNQSKNFDPGLEYDVPNGYQGVVGRVTYDYNKRYLAEFDAGYNGTENFAPGKRFGFFPAYSLGWVLSQEPFFPKNDIVSFAKIRASYGEVGNDKIGGLRFLYLPTSYSFSGSYNLGEVGSTFQSYQASDEGTIGNPYLTWERAKKTDIGLDLTLLKGKFKITADYFLERRDNILSTPGTVPDIVGKTMPALNLGKMKNSGYEAEVNFNNKFGEFNFWVNANFTFARNVIEFEDEVKRSFSYQYRTGQTSGQPFGLITEGFFNTWEEVNAANRPKYSYQNDQIQPGDIRFKDVNGDGIINADDMVPIGYSNFPEKSFGFSFGGNYKGFDFSILFQGAMNVSLNSSPVIMRGFENDRSEFYYLHDYSWTQERYENGSSILFPHLTVKGVNTGNYTESTFMVRDASYLRFKNFEIGYTLSNSLLKKLRLSTVRLFLNGSNLYTWSKLFKGEDPEQIPGGGDYMPYPITRNFSLGLNVKF